MRERERDGVGERERDGVGERERETGGEEWYRRMIGVDLARRKARRSSVHCILREKRGREGERGMREGREREVGREEWYGRVVGVDLNRGSSVDCLLLYQPAGCFCP